MYGASSTIANIVGWKFEIVFGTIMSRLRAGRRTAYQASEQSDVVLGQLLLEMGGAWRADG